MGFLHPFPYVVGVLYLPVCLFFFSSLFLDGTVSILGVLCAGGGYIKETGNEREVLINLISILHVRCQTCLYISLNNIPL